MQLQSQLADASGSSSSAISELQAATAGLKRELAAAAEKAGRLEAEAETAWAGGQSVNKELAANVTRNAELAAELNAKEGERPAALFRRFIIFYFATKNVIAACVLLPFHQLKTVSLPPQPRW